MRHLSRAVFVKFQQRGQLSARPEGAMLEARGGDLGEGFLGSAFWDLKIAPSQCKMTVFAQVFLNECHKFTTVRVSLGVWVTALCSPLEFRA